MKDIQKNAETTRNPENFLVSAAKAIGRAAGAVASSVGADPHSDLKASVPSPTAGKLPKKSKSRLPRRQKKTLQRSQAKRESASLN